MSLRKLVASIATTAVLVFSGPAGAVFDPVGDDTDIFLANPLLQATRPNVMILLDNTANWTTPFATEKQALVNITNTMLTDAFNVGLAMFVETGGGNTGSDGAYVRYGVRQMTPTNKSRFTALVNGLDVGNDKGNNTVPSLSMAELYRYFAGITSVSGFGKVKRDYPFNMTDNPLTADLEGWAYFDRDDPQYVSPIISACQKNFIIYISNGKANESTSALAEAKDYLASFSGASPTTIPLTPSGEQGNWADEFAQFMANADCAPHIDGVQNVITYTLDVLPSVAGSPDWTALLKSMADKGKGRYFAITDTSSTAQLEDALRQIFQEVQAVNSVFASVALPVSVNVRGTNLNQVYIGQFRPDSQKSPRWYGNLKMYKIGQDTSGNAFLVDAKGNRAENSATGFVSPNAESFWTTASSFWNHRTPDENGAGGISDLPDGDLVEKGGSAEGLRIRYPSDQAQRQMYTCVSASGYCASGDLLSASPFAISNTNVTAGDLGVYTKKPVSSITASGTTATATVTAHGWATGNTVKVTGASPNLYNQTAVISVLDANRFTYTLPTTPPANVALATGTNHNLVNGDLVDVSGSSRPGYNVANASITRLDANNFEYAMASPETVASGGHTVIGKKLAASVSGSGFTATATVLNHGYTTGNLVTISGANEAAFNVTDAAITVTNVNTFSYSTILPISGTASTARVTAANHGLSTNQSVTITGSSVAAFNGTFLVSVIDANTFTYTISGFASTTTNPGMVASVAIIQQITHPTGGAGSGTGYGARDVATVTTSVPHFYTNGQTIIIQNAGGVPPAGYDGTWVVNGVSGTNPTTFLINDLNTPVAQRNGNVDGVATPFAVAGMRVGRTVTQIDPVVTATGVIRSAKPVSLTTLSSKAAATGAIMAGRPTDVSPGERDNLILWVRGRDNAENEKTNSTAPDVRPSIHGDVLHSRPAVVNYGRDASENDVYIYYGSNDGGLRAVKGGTATVSGDVHPDTTAVRPGDERWSFIPKELFPKLERQMVRTPAISATDPRDYFVDGPISAFTKDVNEDGKLKASDGDKVYLYAAMRRGGDFLYALDVSDPGAPRFMWRKQAGDTGYGELGQTWSEAKVTRIRANTRPSESPSGNADNLVLVMGAGYDAAVEDIPPCLLSGQSATNVTKKAVGTGLVTYDSSGSCTITGATGSVTTINRTKGRGILVVDALDGHVIWQAGPNPTGATHNVTVADMSYAIPSDVRVVDLNGDGLADSAFVADTGGQVWRVDMADADPRNWKVRKLAMLGSSVDSDINNKRKFVFAPEVTIAQDATGVFLAVLLGAGDREHPFDGLVANTFYMLKDRAETATMGSGSGMRSWTQTTSASSAGTGAAPVAGGVIRDADLYDATSTPGSNSSGWKRRMLPGEKIVSSALVVNGTAIFSTNQPTVLSGGVVDACASNLGVARIYEISVADATTEVTIRAGGGYVPSPVFAAIQIGNTTGVTTSIPTSSTGVCVGAACGTTTTAGGGTPPGGPTTGVVCTGTTCWSVGTLDVGSRRRAYWYREID